MNAKNYVKISNVIGLVSIVLLAIWVFAFVVIQSFDLKVFTKNLTELFGFSVMGILAVMLGALMVNIMLNLTRIADKHNIDNDTKKISKFAIIGIISIFPLIAGGLFLGDYISSAKVRNKAVVYMEKIADSQSFKSKLAQYRFDKEWIKDITLMMDDYTSQEMDGDIEIILKDTIISKEEYLYFNTFHHRFNYLDDTTDLKMDDFEFSFSRTNKNEKEYILKYLNGSPAEDDFFKSSSGYDIYYPVSGAGKRALLHISIYERFGSVGYSKLSRKK